MRNTQISQPNRSIRRVNRLLAAVAGLTLFGRLAEGNTLTWDASGTSAFAPVHGAGTWDTATPLWSDGTNDNIWQNANSDTAVFGNGGTPGNVTLGTGIIAGGIIFNSGDTIDAAGSELDLNAGNITLNNNARASINNFLGGTASVTGNGTLTLTGNVDNSGLGMTVGAGATLILAKESNGGVHAVGGGGLTINSGGIVQLAGSGGDQIYDGADVSNKPGGLFDLNGTSETIRSLYGTGGTVLNSAPGTASTLTFGGSQGDYFGVIEDNAGTGGTVAISVANNGKQKLESANSYTGGTAINSGTLIFNVYNSLGTGPATLGSVSSDATLIADGTNPFTNSVPNAINVDGAGNNTISANGWNPTFSGAISLNNANINLQSNNPFISSLTITGGITGSGNVAIAVLANAASQVNISGAALNNSGTITDNSTTGTANIAAVIGNNVTGLVENSSGSNLVLSAQNTYSGPTMLSAGTLRLSNSNAIQNSTLTMAGGSLVFDSTVSQNAFTFGGLAAFSSGVGYDIALANTAGAAVTLTVGSNNANTKYAGVLSGAGSIIKTGNRVLVLTGGSTYTGSTAVSGGTLDIQNATSLFNGNNGNNAAEAVSIARGATLELDETNPSGEWALGTAGAVTINGNGTLQLNQNTSGTDAGLIALGDQGFGPTVNFKMTGGTIDLQGGTLRNGGNQGGNWTSNKASLNIAAGATLDLWDGNPVIVDGLTGNGTITHTSYGRGGSDLTVGVNNDANGPAVFAGMITETGEFPTSLTKIGTGAQVLTGANSYSAGTIISGGTLSINNATGSGTGSGTVIVANGGTLRGSGTIGNTNGSLSINSGATIAAGPDAGTNGTLTTQAQMWNGGGAYAWKITNLGSAGAAAGSGASGALAGGSGREGFDWDLLNITSGGLDLSSLAFGEPFTVTPLGTITSDDQTWSWVIVQSAGQNSINGVPIGTNLAAGNGGSGLFVLNTSGFTDASNAVSPLSFTLEAVNFGSTEDLVLDYNERPGAGNGGASACSDRTDAAGAAKKASS